MAGPDDPLFAGLVDDAALFPPGNAPMADALRGHDARKDEPWSGDRRPVRLPGGPGRRAARDAAASDQRGAGVARRGPGGARVYDAVRAADAATGVVVVGDRGTARRRSARTGAPGAGRGPAAVRARRRSAPGSSRCPATPPTPRSTWSRASGWHAAKYRTGGVTAGGPPVRGRARRISWWAARSAGCASSSPPGCTTPCGTTSGDGLRAARRAQRAGRRRPGAPRRPTAPGSRRSWPSATAPCWPRRSGPGPRPTARRCATASGRSAAAGSTEPLGELRALGVLEDEEAIW